MSDSDVRKTKELKKQIEEEIELLLKKLKAGTIDRKALQSGLERVRKTAKRMPIFDHG